jgi:hypothetical protein
VSVSPVCCIPQFNQPPAASHIGIPFQVTWNLIAALMPVQVWTNFHFHHISFGDWISLLTLCLAPLVAHIVAGVPAPTYLHSQRPSWRDRICHYNPTSILWRYLAIADRRCRARSWTPADMAASNAIFWTQHGWDGSEEMIQRSQDFCIRPPSNNHIESVSLTTIVTLVVTLQGGQALYSLISGQSHAYAAQIALNTIFYPLALLGLLRLPAAFWLTNDFVYSNIDAWDSDSEHMTNLQPNMGLRSNSTLVMKSTATASSLESAVVPYRFLSQRIWQSVALKCFYLLVLVGLLATCFIMLLYHPNGTVFSTTALTLNLLFMVYFSMSVGTVAAYVLLGRCNTTIIPCIAARWYKIYSGILLGGTLMVFLFAALETRKTPCGLYTTYALESGIDAQLCGPSMYVAVAQQLDANETFVPSAQSDTPTSFQLSSLDLNLPYGLAYRVGKGQSMIASFDGWCVLSDKQGNLESAALFERMNVTIVQK